LEKSNESCSYCKYVTGFFASIIRFLFFDLKEATAIGLSQAMFGKAAVLPFPWTHVDPLFYALPLSAIVFIVVSLQDRSANVNKQSGKT
jgi:solute:Na+ symporter, SSS family